MTTRLTHFLNTEDRSSADLISYGDGTGHCVQIHLGELEIGLHMPTREQLTRLAHDLLDCRAELLGLSHLEEEQTSEAQ